MADDLISRQAAINMCREPRMRNADCSDFELEIMMLPPTQKVGKWIGMSDADGIYWACSECGEEIPRVDDFDPQFDLFHRLKSMEKTNFCPHCGAKMEGG